MGIAEIRALVESKNLILSSQNLAQLIMSARRPTIPNFMQIGSRGASRQMREISKIFLIYIDNAKKLQFNQVLTATCIE